jgi:hypothetical protein
MPNPDKPKKPKKAPCDIKTKYAINAHDPKNQLPFGEVVKATGVGGIGFVFTKNGPHCGIDLDDCRDVQTGVIEPWALEVIKRFNSYSEISPSGTGIHILVKGTIPEGGGNRKGKIEIYSQGRYFTVTGNHLEGTPFAVETRQEELNKLHSEIFGNGATKEDPKPVLNPVPNITDDELLQKAFNSKNGRVIQQLYSGDWQGAGFKSQSEADQALANHLSFWFGKDPAKVDYYFRQSGLMRPKWDEKHGAQTYGEMTVNKAVNSNSPVYSPQVGGNPEPVEDEEIDAIPWPEPIGAEGFRGLAGKIVLAIMPYSEADPAAVLINFLIGFGNLIGRTAHFIADREHYTNLFALLVGDTSTGKKGTSWSHVKKVFAAVDTGWAINRTPGGLSSGEGLIWAIRDPIYKTVVDKKTGEQETFLEDAGESDKRLLLIESEFGRALRAMQREANTLSAVLRESFDSNPKLQSLTKTAKGVASNPHVSLVGHITKTELIALFSNTDLMNGLGNRFLWICSRQSKSLPFPDPLDADVIGELAGLIISAENFAKNQNCIGMDAQAKNLWYDIYDYLGRPIPGILGVVTARGVPIVRRLALIYALLDCSAEVRAVHIRAALAVWKYSEQSARFIFGEKPIDLKISKIETGILDCLKDGRKTQTDISIYFNRNKKASELAAALQALSAKGKIAQEKIKEPTKDKPITYWFLKK